MKKLLIFSVAFFCVLAVVFSTAFYSYQYPFAYGDIIEKYSDEPGLMAAIIRVESRFEAEAVSRRGAVGLMQLMPETAVFVAYSLGESFSEQSLFDPETNIRYGVWYVGYLKKKFTALEDVLAAYNAGEGNVKKWRSEGVAEIPFKETREYVDKVKGFVEHYKKRF